MSDALFGIDGLTPTTLGIIVVVVLVLVGLLAWGLRRRGHMAFIRGGSNRQPRLAVLDAAAVDARRRLVLVRRDNVEHLIMIGGPSDIVVERGINRAAAAARQNPEAAAQAQQQVAAQSAATVAAAVATPKGQQQPQQSKAPPRPEPPKPQPQQIATEPLNMQAAKPAKKPDEQKKADATADKKPAPPMPPQEARPAPPPQAEIKPSAPAAAENGASPAGGSTRPAPPQPAKPSAPAPELAAVAVSAAAASAADQMARLDEKPAQPEAELKDAEVIAPAPPANGPVVEIEPPAEASPVAPAEPVAAPEPEKAFSAELEDVLGASHENPEQDGRSEPEATDDIIELLQPDQKPAEAEAPAINMAEAGEVGGTTAQPSSMSAEELIADFDELLEAEISKAQQVKGSSEPENAAPKPPEHEHQPAPPGSPTASLEDEMKKLLGDLNVKQ